jgi:hypothetical protein
MERREFVKGLTLPELLAKFYKGRKVGAGDSMTKAQKQFAREHGITRLPPSPTFHCPWGFAHVGRNRFSEMTEQDAITYLARFAWPERMRTPRPKVKR